jgi:hypothetical protein
MTTAGFGLKTGGLGPIADGFVITTGLMSGETNSVMRGVLSDFFRATEEALLLLTKLT